MVVFLGCSGCLLAGQAKPGDSSELAGAEQLYRAGKFADAEAGYQTILKASPKLIPAQAGLIRTLLREEKVDDAYEVATSALAGAPDSPVLLTVMGDVRFRRGEMAEAENAYLKALRLDPKEVYAYLGLARIYRAYSLYRHNYDALKKAREIAPDDPEVQRAYFGQLSRKQRIAAIEAYLAGPHPDDPEDTEALENYLEFLKATADKPPHACKLVSKVEQTDTKLEMMFANAHRLRGYGLPVKLNDHNYHLLLDTGASGILVSRKAAEKAGLTRISSERMAGIGDKGLQSGYTAVADHIKVGELEFQDCVVRVADKASFPDEDGLIGADVFGSYLIDIDIPGERLKLAPLPKRPDETSPNTSLNTEAEAGASPEEKSGGQTEGGAAEDKTDAAGAKPSGAAAKDATSSARLPHDRYVAPGMENWTKVFRFGHELLIPTFVNDNKAMLFLIDTGSFANILSVRAARQTTKLNDSSMQVRGLSGSVAKVYTGQKANLTFSHFRQDNQEIVTIDLSTLCRHTGTEVSGILGFNVLRLLEIKIDYRDGLVDFFHPNMPTPRN